MTKLANVKELEQLKKEVAATMGAEKRRIIVSGGTCGRAFGGDELVASVKKELSAQGLEEKVDFRVTGCLGFCEREPIMLVLPERIFYPQPAVKDVAEIITETVINGKVIDRLLYTDPATGEKVVQAPEVPFYKKQEKNVFGRNDKIDPTSITDYIGIGGYGSLAKALSSMKPEQVIDTIKKSGLRGRGGAGFPTGKKWEFCRNAPGDYKYIICNADEGDPGAFMDRSILEGNPNSVLEGMLIGAFAIGANKGIIYVRDEYPLAVERLVNAIKQAKELGLMGKNILGSGFDFEIEIHRGAGAFVCGEETSLIASLENRAGEPRQRPPFPVTKGLWGKPTNINNVKTWANVPLIIDKGADWFAGIGTEGSKGTMIFSLVGKVNNTGLVEVPMGITLREMVYELGGGIKDGKAFKAVQIGGPSGGCIPADLLDLPVDYERLTEAGAMMGSGGMIVMDETTCMVDVAKYFLNFLKGESCGKCTPCREGVMQMHKIISDICDGKGSMEDLKLLEELAAFIKDASLCALGRTAPNPVLTTTRFFMDEYKAHIEDKKCPAGVCKALISYNINAEACTGCTLCATQCPQEAITGDKKAAHTIDPKKCIKCGICKDVCNFGAVRVD